MLFNYVSFLFVEGIELDRIARLSLRQVAALTDVLQKKHRNKLIELASSMRMSQADGKDWKKFVNQLERG